MKKDNDIRVLNAEELDQVSGGARLYASLNRGGFMTFQGGQTAAIDTIDLSDDDTCSVVSKTPFCVVSG